MANPNPKHPHPAKPRPVPLIPEAPPPPPIPDLLTRPVDHPAANLPPDESQDVQGAVKAWGVAFGFVASVLVLSLLGYGLERWVWPKASPWLTVSGLGLGLVSGTFQFIRAAQAMDSKP